MISLISYTSETSIGSRAPKQCIFRIDRQLYENFRLVARRLGLSANKAIEHLIIRFIIENAEKANATVNIYQPISCTITVGDKAKLFLVKTDLERQLSVLERIEKREDAAGKRDILVELAKLLKKAEDLYKRTMDPELGRLLERAAAYLEPNKPEKDQD
jgi:hypothetical protein